MAKARLGELLIEKGLVSKEKIEKALQIQVGGNRRLGGILLKMKCISNDQLIAVLADQLDVPVIIVDREFSPEAKNILPKYLCEKYDAVPLSLDREKNVLKIAMVDPLDDGAIEDIEDYTGHVVWAVPATETEISAAIKNNIPFSIKDIFNPFIYNKVTRVASVVALVLVIAVSGFVYNYMMTEKYGKISYLEDQTIYRNHNLIVIFEKNKKVSFLGQGEFAEGYYAVLFDNKTGLLTFMKNKKEQFSEDQFSWLQWVAEQNYAKKT